MSFYQSESFNFDSKEVLNGTRAHFWNILFEEHAQKDIHQPSADLGKIWLIR